MIVYGEILLAENTVIGGVLLYITAEIFHVALSTRFAVLRLCLGSLLCGAFSMVIFLPVRTWTMVLMEIAFAFAVCFVVFGGKALWKKALTFILVTFFMGGVTMGLLLISANTGIRTAVGVYTGDMKAALLALFAGITLFTAKQIVRTVSRRKFYTEHVCHVRLTAGTLSIEVKAFLDTGNQLRDPVGGRPVAVAAESLWQRMEREGFVTAERFSLIPYESVGDSGILQAVRLDYMELGERRIRTCFIARGNGSFHLEAPERGDGELLLSKDMADWKV